MGRALGQMVAEVIGLSFFALLITEINNLHEVLGASSAKCVECRLCRPASFSFVYLPVCLSSCFEQAFTLSAADVAGNEIKDNIVGFMKYNSLPPELIHEVNFGA